MDPDRMVITGRELVEALERNGMLISASLWVYDEDVDVWKLWIAPQAAIGQHDFYLQVAKTITGDRNRFTDLDVADTKLIDHDHPAIKALKHYAAVTGKSSFRLKNDMSKGFYIKDGLAVSLGH